ncbi:MAG TPA: hypothetical protein VGS62_08640 [Streptosporangiaceae bacterium]|nr:hypothetical protein [Streptosporangiaceae bacterium]
MTTRPPGPGPTADPDPDQGCPARHHERDGYAAAEQLQAQRPQWVIMYGCYTRQLIAWPKFAVSRRVIITTRYPDALISRLDRAEHNYRLHTPGNQPRTADGSAASQP